MKYDIGFNDQRDNINFNLNYPGSKQCFGTAVFGLMSHYSLSIDIHNEKQLSDYIDDVEATIGKKGIGEEAIKNDHSLIRKRTSQFWEVHKLGMNKWLVDLNVKGHAVIEYKTNILRVRNLLDKCPIVIGTDKLGDLPGGHIILAIGYDDIHIIFNDSFGNANTNYKDHNGASVYYEDEMLKKYFMGSIIYWNNWS